MNTKVKSIVLLMVMILMMGLLTACGEKEQVVNNDEVMQKQEAPPTKEVDEDIIETVAGTVIASHCGPGTIGILYMVKEK